jgi:hypothetical protein
MKRSLTLKLMLIQKSLKLILSQRQMPNPIQKMN